MAGIHKLTEKIQEGIASIQTLSVIIPAYNEEKSITKVINDIPTIVDEIIVINKKE